MYVKHAKMRSTINKGKLKKTYDALRTERTFESNLYLTHSHTSLQSLPHFNIPYLFIELGITNWHYKQFTCTFSPHLDSKFNECHVLIVLFLFRLHIHNMRTPITSSGLGIVSEHLIERKLLL